ncbi:hypothetical protein Tco_0718719 [Tanacetum coccineum]
MNTIGMTMQKLQVNTKFVNNLQPKWSKFVNDVKLARDMHELNFDHLYAYLGKHEDHANKVRMMRERFPNTLSLVANSYITPPYYNNHQPQYNTQSQYHQQFSPVAQQFYSPPPPQQFYDTLCTKPKSPRNSNWFKEKMLLAQALESGVVLDEEQMAFLADNGDTVATSQESQELTTKTIFQTDDLDAFDSDCDEAPSSAFIWLIFMLMDFDITLRVTNLDIDITSDSNIISYEQYLNETETADAQDATYSAQQDAMIMSSDRKRCLIKLHNVMLMRVKKHDALSVIDTQETLKLAEESNLKMHAKQNDPFAKEKKVNIAPIDYDALNKLS